MNVYPRLLGDAASTAYAFFHRLCYRGHATHAWRLQREVHDESIDLGRITLRQLIQPRIIPSCYFEVY